MVRRPLQSQRLLDLLHVPPGDVARRAALQRHFDGAAELQVQAGDLAQVDDLRVGDAHEAPGVQLLLQLVEALSDRVGARRRLGLDPLVLGVEAQDVLGAEEKDPLVLKGGDGPRLSVLQPPEQVGDLVGEVRGGPAYFYR